MRANNENTTTHNSPSLCSPGQKVLAQRALRNRLLPLAVAMVLVLTPKLARADFGWGCGLSFIGSIVVGSIFMAVDLGFTVNAVVKAADHPNYPSPGTSKVQIGIMVPQLLITGAGVIFNSLECEDWAIPTVIEAIPLAWSVALLGHGIWALQAADQGSLAHSYSPSVLPPAPLGSRMRVLPAMLGPGAIGVRLQGRF